ncbi:helix-turn-helix transcriptional regulator [Streptomyces lydicus]|uniref:helix-turn-helix transcriptional regulator n=1 Tax=Streptomyces lydicus TaxID=47763 RepID=UPI0037A81EDC
MPIKLTPAEMRIAAHLLYGATNLEIAAKEHLAVQTVRSHLRNIRRLTNCGPRSSRAVLVHTLLATGRITPPPHETAPELSQEELQLMQAIAENSWPSDIARSLGLTPDALSAKTEALVAKAGAADTSHLTALGHAWGFLSSEELHALAHSDASETDRTAPR